MTISDTEEFKHSTSVIFGEGSANDQYCSQANVNNHRKLKARLKSSIESGTDTLLQEQVLLSSCLKMLFLKSMHFNHSRPLCRMKQVQRGLIQ